MPKKELRWGSYNFYKKFCWFLCRIFFRIRISGVENVPSEGPVLFISNHQSFLDPLFCGCPLKMPVLFVARDSLYKGFFGKLITSFNTIPIKRDQADLTAIKEVIRRLREGFSVCLFPEATRTADGRISALKPGFSFLCKKGDAQVVPIVIDGAFECWPRQRKIFRPGRISIRYGEAIAYEKIKLLSDEECAAMLTGALRGMQCQVREELGKDVFEYDKAGVLGEEV